MNLLERVFFEITSSSPSGSSFVDSFKQSLNLVFMAAMFYLIFSLIAFFVSSIISDYARKHKIKSGFVRGIIDNRDEFLHDSIFTFILVIVVILIYCIVR